MMDPSSFDIQEIGVELGPAEGLPDGCDLCGHCRMLAQMKSSRRLAIPCGGGRRFDSENPASPLLVLRD